MDYMKKLDDAITSFEAESRHLKNINSLLQSMDTLLKAVQEEKTTLVKAVQEEKDSLHEGVDWMMEAAGAVQSIQSMGKEFEEKKKELMELMASCESMNNSLQSTLKSKLEEYVKEETEAGQKVIDEARNVLANVSSKADGQLQDRAAELDKVIKQGNELNETFRKNVGQILDDFKLDQAEARDNLVDKIHSTVSADAGDILEKLKQPAEMNQQALTNACSQLSELLDKHKAMQDAIVVAVQQVLNEYTIKGNEKMKLIEQETANTVNAAKSEAVGRINQLDQKLSENAANYHKEMLEAVSGLSSENTVNSAKNEMMGHMDQLVQKVLDNVAICHKETLEAVAAGFNTAKNTLMEQASKSEDAMVTGFDAQAKKVDAMRGMITRLQDSIDAANEKINNMQTMQNLLKVAIGLGVVNLLMAFGK